MTPLFNKFEDYQAFYENRFIPQRISDGFDDFRSRFHSISTSFDGMMLIPKFVVKCIQLGTTILTIVPSLAPLVELPRRLSFEARNIINVLRGVKTTDGVLNFRPDWRAIAINLAGITLFVISIMTVLERYTVYQATTIKASLAAIPLFGILPFGGLYLLSMATLGAMILLFSVEKKKILQEKEQAIKNKCEDWSQSIDLAKVKNREGKYQQEAKALEGEIAVVEGYLKEGEQKVTEFTFVDSWSLYACQKAVNDLSSMLKNKKESLVNLKKKCAQWSDLKTPDPLRIEELRKAHMEKWEKKSRINRLEKEANMVLIAGCILFISKQILTIVGILFGFAFVAASICLGLDVIATGTGCRRFFLKREINQIR